MICGQRPRGFMFDGKEGVALMHVMYNCDLRGWRMQAKSQSDDGRDDDHAMWPPRWQIIVVVILCLLMHWWGRCVGAW